MKYKSYPNYSDPLAETGVSFPAEWSIRRLRFSVQSNPAKSEIGDMNCNELATFIPMEAVGEYGGIDTTRERALEDVYDGYTYFKENDILIAKITPCFENGKGAIAEGLKNGMGFGTTEFHVLRPLEGISTRWLFYLTVSDFFRKLGTAEMRGAGGQKRVPESFIKDFRIGFPSCIEQTQIANFLDYKTAEIDALVAEKRSLIEKLKEQRTAVITQAVTKGLVSDALMRDSGIEWLGQVPANWAVKRLKFVASVRYGLAEPPEYVDEGVFFIRATDVYRGKILKQGVKKVRPEDICWQKNPPLHEGEIIVVRSGAYTGDSAIVAKNYDGAFAGFDMVVRAIDINCEFLAWVLLSRYFLEAQIFQTRVRAAQPHLNSQELGNFVVLVPEPREQEEIVRFINHRIARIDRMMTKVNAAIDNLTEYRIALITAAITGDIDVRNCPSELGVAINAPTNPGIQAEDYGYAS